MNQETVIGGDASAATGSRAIGDGIAMQLASITYCSIGGGNIKNTVAKYMPGWTVVWEPVKAIGGNYAFIAFNGVQYVVAIRGSILDFSYGAFLDWFKEDFNILKQTPWVYTNDPGTNPMISQGAADGLANLTMLMDKNGNTILGFLLKNAIPASKFLCVTGHSLGGNLATVFAPWLLYQIQQAGKSAPAIFSVLTFASPTSWNGAFAEQFDNAFTNSWRYYNVIDIVPFSACNVVGLGNLYPPPAPAATSISATYDGITITLSEVFDAIALIIAGSEIVNKSVYAQVNSKRGSIALNTNQQIYPVTATDPLVQWFEQAGQQHDHNHYLDWLGTPEINCVK